MLQLAYFVGTAMWTYLTQPFTFAHPGFQTTELDPWPEKGEQWRRLRVIWPSRLQHRVSGRQVNANFAGYHIAAHADVPDIEADFVPDYEPGIPLGLKGVGEIGNVGTAAAIANAVWHATGHRQRTLPGPSRPRTGGARPVPWIPGQSPRSRRRAMTVPATHRTFTGRPEGRSMKYGRSGPTDWPATLDTGGFERGRPT
jgi:hypothetical protein